MKRFALIAFLLVTPALAQTPSPATVTISEDLGTRIDNHLMNGGTYNEAISLSRELRAAAQAPAIERARQAEIAAAVKAAKEAPSGADAPAKSP
jgi:hypothetical protein